jgi:hypothetical protein
MRKPPPRPPTLDWEKIRDISEAVYRVRLGPRDTASMIAKDKDEGQKLRQRAEIYDPLVVPMAEAMGIPRSRFELGGLTTEKTPEEDPLPPK